MNEKGKKSKEIPVRFIDKDIREPDLSGDFNIRNLENLLSGENMFQELHRHDFYFILALESGQGNHEIDFKSYELHDYSVFLMRPGQVHTLNLKASSTGYLIQFTTDFYYSQQKESNHIFRRVRSKNFYPLDSFRYQNIRPILDGIFQEFINKNGKHEKAIKSYLDILFIKLFREHDKNEEKKVDLYKQQRLEEFIELVENHIFTIKQVSQYAKKLNLSPYQLNSVTKALLGKTSSEVINEYIILESKRHLLATSNQIKEIAYHLGYDDVSYFIRFFKKHTGYSPETFRQHFR